MYRWFSKQRERIAEMQIGAELDMRTSTFSHETIPPVKVDSHIGESPGHGSTNLTQRFLPAEESLLCTSSTYNMYHRIEHMYIGILRRNTMHRLSRVPSP